MSEPIEERVSPSLRRSEEDDHLGHGNGRGTGNDRGPQGVVTGTRSEEGSPVATGSDGASLSGRQRKKLLRNQKWEEEREARKQRRKEKKKRPRRRFRRPPSAPPPGPDSLRLAVDCGFDGLMSPRDVRKLRKQIRRCYAENRRAARPVRFHLTSVGGRLRRDMDAKDGGWANWKGVAVTAEHYGAVLPRDEVVYLTADSPNVLGARLDPSKAYVIGGLVDHNHHKGLTLAKAEELGVEHARLPLGGHVRMDGRRVLAVNHVFEIMLAYLEKGDWREALVSVLPRRKGATPLGEDSDSDAENGGGTTPEKNGAGTRDHQSQHGTGTQN